MLSGCLSFNTAAPPRVAGPVEDVLLRGRDGNWRVRVHADSTYSGRVTFVAADAARIGDVRVPFAAVQRVDRRYDRDAGGKKTGAVIGAAIGVGLGFMGIGFWEYGNERKCSPWCQIRIVAPTSAVVGLIGGLIGGAIDPPTHGWATVWER